MVAKTQFDPQNPDALFSPDQWLNQFSNFNNAALPWPSSYAGMPTDAMGNPIQPPPGMTINSPPQAPAASAAPAAQTGPPLGSPASGLYQQGYGDWSQLDPLLGRSSLPQAAQQQAQASAAAPAAASASAPSGPTYPQILSMLANPGKVTTPGATVPQTASVQPGSANLQSFLKNWQPAQSGPGSGFQQNFSTALKGMGY
jgi:hypothetical protein